MQLRYSLPRRRTISARRRRRIQSALGATPGPQMYKTGRMYRWLPRPPTLVLEAAPLAPQAYLTHVPCILSICRAWTALACACADASAGTAHALRAGASGRGRACARCHRRPAAKRARPGRGPARGHVQADPPARCPVAALQDRRRRRRRPRQRSLRSSAMTQPTAGCRTGC